MEKREWEKLQVGDNLEKAIERYTNQGRVYGLNSGVKLIEVDVMLQLLDHFIPHWRKQNDQYYKMRRFATEQQMDDNLNKIRVYIDKQDDEIKKEINKMHETVDEFQADAAELRRILEKLKGLSELL